MTAYTEYHIDEATISRIGLRLSDTPVKEHLSRNARIFEFPTLENVFVMESDFYGNQMPDGFCFLAFYGRHGLLGEELLVETLRKASAEDIKKMVQSNIEG